MEKRTWTKLIVIILLVAGIGVGIFRQWYWNTDDAGPAAAWGVGNLRAGEKGYYTNRINNIITNWQNTRRDAERGEEGRFTESYKALLVIDTDKGCMWIEDAGRIQQENHTELPAKMKWTLYHTTPQGSSELAGQTRLKLRGYNSSQHRPEQFHIVGTGRGIGYMDLHFGTSSRGSRSGSGRYNPSVYSSSRKETEDLYPSLIVAEAEYQQYRASVAAAEPNEPTDLSPLEKSRVSWRKVEKLLYQEIEKEVLTAGVTVRSIKTEPGPDYSAAHAEVGVRTEGFFRGMFGGYYRGDIYLKIDHLEDDIWFAKTAVNPQRPWLRRGQIDLEFLICPSAPIPDSKRAELLEKGRTIQKPLATAPSKWKTTLPNGATVRFVGICENPSAGKQWWGPDGTPIEYVPYVNSEAHGQPRDDRKTYEMVWEIKFPQMPDGSSGGGTSTNLEGSLGSYGWLV
ncbi:MAG: hypothetical protein ISS79_13860, partial [Phycisphaerae bacterium]|nr:hypothetical protein [Phycisphaerae bacterium]